MPPALLTSADVAAMLGITEKTFRNWRWAGRFDDLPPPIEFGRTKRYRRADVEAFIERHAMASA
jgi:predicted DNA-binding transcriptional regulator AlpA